MRGGDAGGGKPGCRLGGLLETCRQAAHLIHRIPCSRHNKFEVCLGKAGRDTMQRTLQIAERPRVATAPEFLTIGVEAYDQRNHRGQYRS